MFFIKLLIFGAVALSPCGGSDEPSASEGFIFMYAYKNFSEKNIVEEYEGIVYTEQWVPVIGYEEHYRISSFGRIKSIDRRLPCYGGIRFHKGRIKHQTSHYNNQYLSVMLKVGGVEERCLMHRLVGEHFIPNPENKPEVNHIDGDKFDCRFFRLEWSTAKENSNHALDTGLNPNQHPVFIVKDMAIIEFRSKNLCAKFLSVEASWIGTCVDSERIIKGYKVYSL